MIDLDELLFIVDEHNQPIEPQPRQLAHAQRSWHRCCHIWIVNDQQEVLCQKRSLLKDNNPGLWEPFFGGHLNPGQTYLQSAVRELSEELGLEIDQTVINYVREERLPNHPEYVGIFTYFWNGDTSDLRLEADEVSQVAWHSLNTITEKVQHTDLLWHIPPYDLSFLDKHM